MAPLAGPADLGIFVHRLRKAAVPITGGSWAVTGGTAPSHRSTSTSSECADGACASFEVPLSSVSTFGLPCLSMAPMRPGSTGIVPGAGGEPDDAGSHHLRHMRAGKTRTAIVVNAHEIALADAAAGGVARIDP